VKFEQAGFGAAQLANLPLGASEPRGEVVLPRIGQRRLKNAFELSAIRFHTTGKLQDFRDAHPLRADGHTLDHVPGAQFTFGSALKIPVRMVPSRYLTSRGCPTLTEIKRAFGICVGLVRNAGPKSPTNLD